MRPEAMANASVDFKMRPFGFVLLHWSSLDVQRLVISRRSDAHVLRRMTTEKPTMGDGAPTRPRFNAEVALSV